MPASSTNKALCQPTPRNAISCGARTKTIGALAGMGAAVSRLFVKPLRALLAAVLQQQKPFRLDLMTRMDLLLCPTDDGDAYKLIHLKRRKNAAVNRNLLQLIHH